MATFKSSGTDKDVKVQPTGTGKVVVGTGAAAATVASDGDNDLVLQTGNATTGSITITDGADGNIAITPNGTGEVALPKVNIDGGAIDGVTIGGSSAGAVTTTSLVATTADINGGTIDGTTIGGTTPAAGSFTQVNAGDGAEATPSITNTGDTNTGIFFPAADTVGISTNGSERMRIDSSGDVQLTGSLTAGTIGSNVVFPSGIYKNFELVTNSSTILENSTSFQDALISAATINLSSTSSKVLVFVKCHIDTFYDGCSVTVYSNASGSYANIITTGSNLSMIRLFKHSSIRTSITLSGFFLHSPGVSGNVSYKIYLKSDGGSNAWINGPTETTCLGIAEIL